MKTILLLAIAYLLFSSKPQQDNEVGRKLFYENCVQCHTIGRGKIIGPDLKNIVLQRDSAWLYQWIKSSQSLIKSGDKIAVEIFKQYYRTVQPDFNLSDKEIKALLDYIKEESKPKEQHK